jgi:aldehyde decarbonylase
VLHMIPEGTDEVLLLGDAGGNKMAGVLASALCEREIQVRI